MSNRPTGSARGSALARGRPRRRPAHAPLPPPAPCPLPPPASHRPTGAGIRADVFVRDAGGDVIIGKVWPGATAFPDFLAPNATDWWADEIAAFHALLPFDGLWIDMNEPANFVTGSSVGCPDR